MSEERTLESSGISRRDVLKRGAVAGGLVWAAPAISTLGSGAFASEGGSPNTICYSLKLEDDPSATGVPVGNHVFCQPGYDEDTPDSPGTCGDPHHQNGCQRFIDGGGRVATSRCGRNDDGVAGRESDCKRWVVTLPENCTYVENSGAIKRGGPPETDTCLVHGEAGATITASEDGRTVTFTVPQSSTAISHVELDFCCESTN